MDLEDGFSTPEPATTGRFQRDASSLQQLNTLFAISDDTLSGSLRHSLLSATIADNVAAVKSLLVLGQHQVDSADKLGLTPLYHACAKGHLEIAELLLDGGADIKKQIASTRRNNPFDDDEESSQHNGCTALHAAANGGWLDVVKLLLARGADLHILNKHGLTPFHLSCYRGHWDIAAELLDAGAIIDAGFRPEYGIAGVDYFSADDDGITPLHLAVLSGSKKTLQLLLEKHARCDAVTKYGKTAFNLACEAGHKKLAELLAMNLVEFESYSDNGDTNLHCAAEQGMEEAVFVMLSNGAKVNAVNLDGFTPLHSACSGECSVGIRNVVECLLKKGAHINTVTTGTGNRNCFPERSTPLHLAVSSLSMLGNQDEFFKLWDLLLSCGADVNLENGDGQTPLTILLQHHGPTSVGACMFVKHFAERRARCDFISEENMKVVSLYNVLRNFNDACEGEILRMRERKVGDSTITCFDLFVNHVQRFTDYSENESIIRVLESEEFVVDFPIFAGDMRRNFENAKERKHLQRESTGVLTCSKLRCLPYECISKIYSFLSNQDLSDVIKAKQKRASHPMR